MKRISAAEENLKKTSASSSPAKASAISKQVLKSNPIPQKVNLISDTTVKPKAQPLRSSKVSQKLVLFPQSTEPDATLARQHSIDGGDYLRSTHHTTGVALPTEWTFGSRTQAERMSKDERDFAQLPRVAAYCTGEGYSLSRLRPFLREHHHVSSRQYDEALYAAYHFPLMTLRPDKDNLFNIRVRSASPRPPLRRFISSSTPVENILHEAEMNYDEDHYDQENISNINFNNHPRPGYPYPHYDHHVPTDELQHHADENRITTSTTEDNDNKKDNTINEQQEEQERHDQHEEEEEDQGRTPFEGGEVFIFDYGVVVFWNFSRAEELLMLEDLAPFSIRPFRDNPDEDLQIEEMHFQYDTSQLKPRIFNDMITMKTGNHMIKLTLSHGLSQKMAETGRLGKTRTEITKINGQLFNLRMNVNLVSNVLDTPEIFWSEPALQPMYSAIREYLEISQRVKILNDRLRVISDLLSMLRDHLTNFGVEYQTLIIIYLIIIAVIVACFEIAVKILQSIKL
ncbi:hypothetical protein BJ944DRAFT_164330 [Cunninghamella echinulata]|nr:hypothetical protein BJ944DRAFT_164330 [Cunninghamella echinulata]